MFESWKLRARQKSIRVSAERLVQKHWTERKEVSGDAWKCRLVSDVLNHYPPEDQEDLVSEAGRIIRSKVEKEEFEDSMRTQISAHLIRVLNDNL